MKQELVEKIEAHPDPAPIRSPWKNRLGMHESPDLPKGHYQKVTITLPPAMFYDLDDLANWSAKQKVQV